MNHTTSLESPLPHPGLPVRRVLVPVDFSHEGVRAIEYAREFANTVGAHIFLLHVIETLAYAGEFSSVLLDSPKAQLQCLEHLQDLQRHVFADQKTATVVREGTPYLEIVNACTELDCDLIIIGTHGRTGLKHVLMGSTAERVVRHSTRPILIIPSRAEPH